MDTQEQIDQFRKFIEEFYNLELLEIARTGKKSITLDFRKLSKFDIHLSEDLLDDPEEVLKSVEIAIEQFDVPKSSIVINARISNLPKSNRIMLRNIRSEHLSQFVVFEGVVRQKSDVRPQVSSARFECPSCGNILPVLQLEKKFKEPSRCGCGRKGKFKMLSKDLIDAQNITLEECIEYLDGGQQPKKMKVFLKDDLTSPMTDNMANPGTKILINGYVKEVPVLLRTGGQSTIYDLMIEANYIESVEEEFGSIKISKSDEKEIKNLSKNPEILKMLVESFAPSICGHNIIKEALLVQLAGGVKKKRKDGTRQRGDMHILLIGDPGAGKSQLLKRVNIVAPKSRFISGKGASGPGITATVVKDDFMGGWALEAGAIVLANKGTICIDELDKISKEDTSSLHEALEGQRVIINKANIQATLKCETTVLAAANPKFGKFDLYSKTLAEQIELPTTLINRFDMIFPMKDIPDPKKDERLARFVFDLNEDELADPPINTPMLRKYIAYAKKLKPKYSREMVELCVKYYTDIRSKGNSESGMEPIPISPRQLEGIMRLAEAYAKIHLSNTVTVNHAEKSIKLMNYWLKQIAYDSETKAVDLSMYNFGIKTSQSDKMSYVFNLVKSYADETKRYISIDEIHKKGLEKGFSEDDIYKMIKKLRRKGDIYEPQNGFLGEVR